MYGTFNPIALRKAKIVYNFGLSGCSRVDATLLHSEKPKLYTILAFLNAIGLMPQSFATLTTSGLKNSRDLCIIFFKAPVDAQDFDDKCLIRSCKKLPPLGPCLTIEVTIIVPVILTYYFYSTSTASLILGAAGTTLT